MTVNQSHFGLTDLFLVDNACIRHFVVKVISLTRTLTNTGEYGITAVCLSNVVDQLHDDNGLTNTRTTESTNFTTLSKRADKVDDLDTSLEDLGVSCLVNQFWWKAVDRATLVGCDWALFVHCITSNVEDAAENGFTYRDGDR